MPDYLPDVIGASREVAPVSKRAIQAQQAATLNLFEHELRAAVRSQKDQIDTHALGDALACAAEEEMSFLDWGLERSNGSAAKLAIVAAKVSIFARKNNQRIERSF